MQGAKETRKMEHTSANQDKEEVNDKLKNTLEEKDLCHHESWC